MPHDRPDEILSAYMQDAIAAERSFETQLRALAREADDVRVGRLFAEHADETRAHYERLTARLNEVGARCSNAESFLAHLYGMTPRAAQIAHGRKEHTTEDLIIAYAVENSEIARYEALAVAALAAADSVTEQLARKIQEEERMAAERVWRMLGPSARRAFDKHTVEAA